MCGLFAVVGHPRAAALAADGLAALQHRGQASAGLVAGDAQQWVVRRRAGLWREAWSAWQQDGTIAQWQQADWALGHLRYPTSGHAHETAAQPLTTTAQGHLLAVAHNGQLTNASPLWRQVGDLAADEDRSDTAVILTLLQRQEQPSMAERLLAVLPQLQGAYSLAVWTPDGLLLARDPYGFRPLVLGSLEHATGTAWLAASEASALVACGATLLREVEPGEVIGIGATGLVPYGRVGTAAGRQACVFEPVYFAAPTGSVLGCDTASMRQACGERLADEAGPRQADAVVGVPESGLLAAAGYARRTGLPLLPGLARSVQSGRSFLLPSAALREHAVHAKLHAIREVVQGRALVVVDDSLVRGTTARAVVAMLRQAGAAAVHLRIASPAVRWPCWYGIDTPEAAQLAAAARNPEDLCRWLGADSVGYLSLDGLLQSTGRRDWCTACFDGSHPLRPQL